MKFGKVIVTQSYTRTPTFDSTNGLDGMYVFECINCPSRIELELGHLPGKEYGWHDDFDKDTQEQIIEHYRINLVGKSPDGGHPAMVTCQCGICSTTYLVYVGIAEVANSVYRITMQGITEIVDE